MQASVAAAMCVHMLLCARNHIDSRACTSCFGAHLDPTRMAACHLMSADLVHCAVQPCSLSSQLAQQRAVMSLSRVGRPGCTMTLGHLRSWQQARVTALCQTRTSRLVMRAAVAWTELHMRSKPRYPLPDRQKG